MSKLNGKVAVITGGNSGIGLSTARRFVQEGAKVVIFGRNQSRLDRAAETLGPNALGVQGEVTKIEDLDRLFATAKQRFGGIDILFANAGIAEFSPFEEVDEDHFDRVMDVDVKGAFFTAQRALPVLNDGGTIIFTASVVNVKGVPGSSVYSATKAAVRSFARVLSVELAPRKIRVNVVSPGLTDTPILSAGGLGDAEVAGFAQQVSGVTPLGRLAEPAEIANVVTFLASDEASYVNGSEFAVDGGFAQI